MAVSLRGVHWFNNSRTDLPHDGWNVETVIGVSNPDDSYNSVAVTNVRDRCIDAQTYGLTTIVRLDWKNGLVVPTQQSDYNSWTDHITNAVQTLNNDAGVTIFIIGNEPNIGPEGHISPSEYARAFNNVFGFRTAGTQFLAAGPAAFSLFDDQTNDVTWLLKASDGINSLDGWALHAYATPGGDDEPCAPFDTRCPDPASPCGPCEGQAAIPPSRPDPHDHSFRRYRDYISQLEAKWSGKPVYLTEFNTAGWGYSPDNRARTSPAGSYPSANFPIPGSNFMQRAYEEIRNFNNDPVTTMKVHCLCWFVDEDLGGWSDFSLSNTSAPKLVQARADFITADASPGT